MSITSQLADKIWDRKKELGSLSNVHNEFIRSGGNCSYELFRQFAHESTNGSGSLINDLNRYFEQIELKEAGK